MLYVCMHALQACLNALVIMGLKKKEKPCAFQNEVFLQSNGLNVVEFSSKLSLKSFLQRPKFH